MKRMKIDLSTIVKGLRDFNINSAVAAFAVGLFQNNARGYALTACFLIAFVLLTLKRKKERKEEKEKKEKRNEHCIFNRICIYCSFLLFDLLLYSEA